MSDKIINERDCKIDKMLEAFLSVGYKNITSTKYATYTYKRVNQQIFLLKGKKKIAVWNIVDDSILVFEDLSTSEKRVANKFVKLPSLADKFYKIERGNNKQIVKKEDKYGEARSEIKQILNAIPDVEVTKERLTNLINQFADKYIYDWEGDCSADHFNDNYMSYLTQTRSVIESIMINSGDKRVSNLLASPNDKVYWDKFSDDELIKMIKIIPLSAQREGNLITIIEEEHKKFENLCEGGFKYIKENLLKHSLREFVPHAIIEVCWWEKELTGENFFVPALVEEEHNLNTYREVVLERLQPKQIRSAKPSRLSVKIFFDERDKEGNVRLLLKKHVPKLGVITWNANI